MRNVVSRVPLAALALSLSWAGQVGAWARADAAPVFPEQDHRTPRIVTVQGGPVSLSQARQMAQQRFPGRVVRAETLVLRGNRRVHQIRILDTEGRVRDVRVDAETGRFL